MISCGEHSVTRSNPSLCAACRSFSLITPHSCTSPLNAAGPRCSRRLGNHGCSRRAACQRRVADIWRLSSVCDQLWPPWHISHGRSHCKLLSWSDDDDDDVAGRRHLVGELDRHHHRRSFTTFSSFVACMFYQTNARRHLSDSLSFSVQAFTLRFSL